MLKEDVGLTTNEPEDSDMLQCSWDLQYVPYVAILCDLYFFRLNFLLEKIKVNMVWSTASLRSGIGSLLMD